MLALEELVLNLRPMPLDWLQYPGLLAIDRYQYGYLLRTRYNAESRSLDIRIGHQKELACNEYASDLIQCNRKYPSNLFH